MTCDSDIIFVESRLKGGDLTNKKFFEKKLAHTWSGFLIFTDFHAKMRVKIVKFMNEFREFPKISRILQKMKYSEIVVILPHPTPSTVQDLCGHVRRYVALPSALGPRGPRSWLKVGFTHKILMKFQNY